MDLSKDGEVDVAVDVHQVVALFVGSTVAEGEGRGQFLLVRIRGGDDDAQLVIGGDGGFKFVLDFDLAAMGHVLEVVDPAGGDARSCRRQDGN